MYGIKNAPLIESFTVQSTWADSRRCEFMFLL